MRLPFSLLKVIQLTFKIVIIQLLILIANRAEAQNEIIEELVKSAREGKIYDANRILNFTKTKADVYKILASFKKYHNDSLRSVKLMIFSTEYKIAKSQKDINIRKAVSTSLANALSDKDPFIWQSVARQLQSFRTTEFSDESKATIINLINKKQVKREYIILAGIAELKSQIERIRKILFENDSIALSTERDTRLSWTCHLVLARLGVESELSYCLKRVEIEKDDVIRVTILLKDLAYTRQQGAIKVIQSYLESEERLPSVVPGEIGAKYCVYAINLLAQVIEDFPVSSNSIYYSDNEIERCRQWVRENRTYRIIK